MPKQLPLVRPTVGAPRQGPNAVLSPSLGTQQFSAGIDAARAKGQLASQIGKISDHLFELGEAERQAKAALEVAKGKSRLRNEYDAWFFERSQNPLGHETLHDDAREKLRELSETVLEGVKDRDAKAKLSAEVANFSASSLLSARQTARKQFVGVAKADLADLSADARSRAAYATNPAELQMAADEHLGLLQQMMVSGVIDAEQFQAERQAFLSGVTEDRVRASIRDDPSGTLATLRDVRQMTSLTPETRNRLTDAAQRAHDSARREEDMRLRRAEMQQERAMRRRSAQEFNRLIVQGENLTSSMIDHAIIEGGLDGAAASRLYSIAEQNATDAQDDPAAVQRLQEDLLAGKLDPRNVLFARERKLISNSTRDRLLGQNLAGAGITDTQRYQDARELFDVAMGAFQGVGLGAATGQLMSMAYEELRQRVLDGEDPMDVVVGVPGDPSKPGLRARYATDFMNMIPEPRYSSIDALMQAAPTLSPAEVGRQRRLIEAMEAGKTVVGRGLSR